MKRIAFGTIIVFLLQVVLINADSKQGIVKTRLDLTRISYTAGVICHLYQPFK